MFDQFTLDVGGVILAVQLPSLEWLPALEERYRSFLSSATPDWNVRLIHDPGMADTNAPWLRHQGNLSVFRVNAYSGWIDLAGRCAAVSTPSEARAVSALERTLAYICMQALPRDHGSLLLHGVGIEVDGQGHVFFGPSGAGKTTIAQLSEGFGRVLSDESVILKVTPDGIALLSTPFWGMSTPPSMVRREPRSTPLCALYSLAHTSGFRLDRLSPWEAVTALLASEKVAVERVESAEAWLTVADLVLQRAPLYRLSFPPTRDLWPFIMSTLSAHEA